MDRVVGDRVEPVLRALCLGLLSGEFLNFPFVRASWWG